MGEQQLGVSFRNSRATYSLLKSGIAVTLPVVLSAIIAVIALSISSKAGRLSVPPLYDDVVYFIHATRWLRGASTNSLAANIYALLDQHAPFATLQAAIGLAWIPDSYVGPYAVNTAIVAAFLFGIAMLVRRLSTIDIVTCITATACVPMLSQTMTEARPDLPWGLAVALAIGAILYRPFSARSYGSVLRLGVLCGLAAAIKPSALPVSLFCLGFAVVAQLTCDALEAGVCSFAATRPFASRGLIFAGGMLVGAAAVVGVHIRDNIGYIWEVLVLQRDFWAASGSLFDQLTFYVIGPGGKTALNTWLWIGTVLFAARLAISSRRDRSDLRRALTLLAVVLVAYAVPTYSTMKSYFLGAVFYGVFIVAIVLNFAAIIGLLQRDQASKLYVYEHSGCRRTAPHLTMLSIVVVVFVTQVGGGWVALSTKLDPNVISNIRAAVPRVWSVLTDSLQSPPLLAQRPNGPIITFLSPYPVSAATIQLYALQSNLKLDVREGYFLRTVDEAVSNLLASDLAIVTSSMPHNLPGPRMGDEVIRRLDVDPNMCLVDSTSYLTVREMRIYRHSESGCGLH
jgi:hypothetical protein